jgi:hypothetical protein
MSNAVMFRGYQNAKDFNSGVKGCPCWILPVLNKQALEGTVDKHLSIWVCSVTIFEDLMLIITLVSEEEIVEGWNLFYK